MPNKPKRRVGTPKADVFVSEIARLKFDLEQERLKSQRYRVAAETAANLIYEWDLSSRVEWLGRVDELLGYQPNEIPRTWEGFTSLLHPEDRDRLLVAIEKHLKSHEPYCVECRVRRKDGTYLYWQDRGSTIRDESGKPLKWVGAISDISERKRAETELKGLLKRQEAILSAVPDILMEVDKKKIYTWANQAGIDFFGEDVIGKEAADFFEGEQDTYKIVQTVFEGQEDVIDVESWQRRRDGKKRLLAWRCRTLKDEFGNAVGALSAAVDITEKAKYEADIQDLARFPDEEPDPVLRIAGNGLLLYVNGAALRLLPEWRLQSGQAAPPELRDIVTRTLHDGVVSTYDLKHHDRHFSFSVAPILKTGYANLYGRDITDLMRAFEMLSTREAELSNALKMARAGHWMYDIGQDLFTFNDNFYGIFRTTAAEVGGYQMSSAEYARRFCHPDDAALVGMETRAAIESADPSYSRQIEHRILYADGEGGVMTVRFFIVKDEHGRTVKTYGVNQDITALKLAEKSLRESEEKYRILVENAAEMILIAQDGRLKFANRKAIELTGYSERELRSLPFIEFVHPDDRQMISERYSRRIEGDTSLPRYAFRVLGKDGSTRWAEIDAVLITWEGKPATLNFISDISERQKAESSLQQTLKDLRNALGGVIQVLSAVSEMRDPYTAGHQRRVADLARAIAQDMGLAPQRVNGIRVAGQIHDIGKLAVPAEILSKPTRLSKIEYEMIQSHAQSGYDILAGIEFGWPLAQIILQHHERMDGSGYPRKLKGEDILLESRILAVSDVIEAIASHRPYRPALGIDAALREIENDKGVLYDPAVVAACLRLFREKGFAFKD